MSLPQPRKQIQMPYATLEFYPSFVVSTPTSDMGYHTREFYAELVQHLLANFDQPFGYIGNRANLNAADPSLFEHARRDLPLWKAFAIVSYSPLTDSIFALESQILADLPHRRFDNLPEAIAWMHQTIAPLRSPN